MSPIFGFSHFRTTLFGVFALAILSTLLVPSPFSYGQYPASQDSPVIEIPESSWHYRWGVSPEDNQGMPLWIYEDTSNPEWKPVKGSSDFRKNPQKHNTL